MNLAEPSGKKAQVRCGSLKVPTHGFLKFTQVRIGMKMVVTSADSQILSRIKTIQFIPGCPAMGHREDIVYAQHENKLSGEVNESLSTVM